MHRCRRIGRVVVVSRRDAAKPGPGHTASPTFFLNSEPLLSPSVCVCVLLLLSSSSPPPSSPSLGVLSFLGIEKHVAAEAEQAAVATLATYTTTAAASPPQLPAPTTTSTRSGVERVAKGHKRLQVGPQVSLPHSATARKIAGARSSRFSVAGCWWAKHAPLTLPKKVSFIRLHIHTVNIVIHIYIHTFTSTQSDWSSCSTPAPTTTVDRHRQRRSAVTHQTAGYPLTGLRLAGRQPGGCQHTRTMATK